MRKENTKMFEYLFQNNDGDEDGGNAVVGSYRSGPTKGGTFIGTCSRCGMVWEFENYEVVPVPYPHGTCPTCREWVKVF